MIVFDKTFDEIYNRNIDAVYKVCFMYVKNKHDAEDLTQTTFLKYYKSNKVFESEQHEKNWFLLTASNTCKNHFKTWWNKSTLLTEDFTIATNDLNKENLEIILTLPNKYKMLIYLYYYEGYKSKEIAKMLNKNESTIRSDLHKAKKILKEKLRSEL